MRPLVALIAMLVTAAAVLLASAHALAAPGHRAVTIWSDGTRLAGDLWWPEDAAEDAALPAILMAHGWGGVRSHLNTAYAPAFAEAGFVVLTFDYRGWGGSDPKLSIVGELPALNGNGEATVRVQAIREVVDPFDQLEDLRAALAFLLGEPMVDAGRVGAWGTSYSGGHVIQLAADDARIRAVVSQVGYQDSREGVRRRFAAEGGDAHAHRRATQKARGEVGPQPPPEDRVPRLRGTPDVARMARYRPIMAASRVRAAALFIDQEDEELFDRRNHGLAAYEIVRQNAPARYELFPGKHYDVYSRHVAQATTLAIGWFREHLAAR